MHHGRVFRVTEKPTTPQTVTVSAEHDADPDHVTAVIADPLNLPIWAPKFAERVAPLAGGRWVAIRGTASFTFTIAEVRDAGVIDVLRERPDGEPVFGARFRAMPRDGGGSVVTMTMAAFGDATGSARAAAAELAALMRLVG